jgi:hypothetical protein
MYGTQTAPMALTHLQYCLCRYSFHDFHLQTFITEHRGRKNVDIQLLKESAVTQTDVD